MVFFSHLADWTPKLKISEESPNSWIPWHCTMVSMPWLPQGIKMPLLLGPTYGISCNFTKASHDIALRHYVSCTNMYHMLPHAITCQLSKARHQVPLSKKYMSLHQGITCHCPKGQAIDGRYQLQMPHGNKSNSPNFRHYMPLPHGISCNCLKALHAKVSPIIVPNITCHYTMPKLHTRYYTGQKQKTLKDS